MAGFLPILKIGAVGSVIAGTTATCGLGFYYKKEIGDYLISLSRNNKPQTNKFVYVVVKYTPPKTTVDTGKKLIEEQNQNFICQIKSRDTQDQNCLLYKFPSSSDSSRSIDLEKILQDEANKVTLHSELTEGNNYLAKLSVDFYEKFQVGIHKTFQIVESNGTALGLFTKVSGFISESNNKLNIETANIFVVKLSEDVSTSTDVENYESLLCKLGDTGIDIACKGYKLSADSPYSNANLPGAISQIKKEDLASGKYLIIDFLDVPKTIKDVENQVIILKQSTSTKKAEVAKGYVEQILIGSVNRTTPADSKLLIVENANSSLTAGTVDNKDSAYVLTKGGETHTFLKASPYSKDAYQCRVVVGNEKFDDADCDLYPFDKAPNNNVFDTSKLIAGQTITEQEDLLTNKYQVIKLAKTLQEKLNTLSTDQRKIEIIKKDRATSAWNHSLVSLTHVADLIKGSETTSALSSNLLLVRAKSKTTSTGALTSESSLKCTVFGDADTVLPCKLYKFAAPKTTNVLTSSEIKTLDDSISFVDADFTVNQYYVVELTNSRKSISDLKNKEITIKNDVNAGLGIVTFDQLIFGKPKVIGALTQRKEHIYIVEKSGETGEWADIVLPSSYRCKLASTDGKIDNFDDGCKLTKLSSQDTSITLLSSEDIKSNPTGVDANWKLKDDAESSYRLKLDLNKIYNIDPTTFEDTEIVIEVLDASTSATTYGKFKLVNDLTTDNDPKGKASLIVGKVTAAVDAGSLTAGKCNFTSITPTSGKVDCTAFKNSGSTSELNKATFPTAIADTDTVAINQYVLIKLNDPQSITTLKGHNNIYFKATDTNKQAVTVKIEAILGGSNETNKKVFFLHKKNA